MRKASYPPLITELPYATLTQLHRDRINVIAMSAFGGKADMAACGAKCPLMTQSGRSHLGPDPSPVTALPGFAGAFRTAAQAGGKSLSFRPLANGETTLGIMRRKIQSANQ